MTDTKSKVTMQYDVEIKSLMSTIINSLYSDKSLCFRELISNSSDACDKFQISYNDICAAVPSSTIMKKPSDLCITISIMNISDNQSCICIEDDGIGMTKTELSSFLGTIASSGTKKFKEIMAENKFNQNSEMKKMIGQFGLGFYSAFLIADRVMVVSKSVYEEGTHVFESNTVGEYSIYESADEDGILKKINGHGTRVIMFVRDGDEKFKDVSVIEEYVKKYSMFIPYPIYLMKNEEKEFDDEEKIEIKDENNNVDEKVAEVIDENNNADQKVVEDVDENNNNVDEKAVDENNNEKVMEVKEDDPVVTEVRKKVKRTVSVPTLINKEKPLWMLKPSNVSKEQYMSFYKTISSDWDDYLSVKHCTLEGYINLTLLLFIPKRNKQSFFEKKEKDTTNVKLYVSNVFVTSQFTSDVLPEWASFIYGVVASDDIPMNVSREICQGTNTMKMVKNNLVKKVVEMIEKLDDESSKTFMKEFGSNIKIGIRESKDSMQERLARLLKFYTSKSLDKEITLEEYLTRKKELFNNQTNDNEGVKDVNNNDTSSTSNEILVLTGLNKEEVINSPFLSLYPNEEVILMYEPVDEVMLQGFQKYKTFDIKRITSITHTEKKANVDESKQSSFTEFVNAYKEVLKEQVEKIVLKDLPSKVPCLVSTAAYGYSAAMEQMIRSQPGSESNPMINMMFKTKKIFEININSKVIEDLKKKYENKNESWKLEGEVIFLTGMIECGFKIEDGTEYAKKIFKMMEMRNNEVNNEINNNLTQEKKVEEIN